MKKHLCLLFTLCIMFTFVCCDKGNEENNGTNTSQTTTNDSKMKSDTFISQDTRNSWRADLIATLSGKDIRGLEDSITGSFAVGLMDLNFDSVPEVLMAYPGGSMGNVYIEIYDLKTHSRLLVYDGMHYGNADEVRIYLSKTDEGYVTLAEGAIRDPESGWCNAIDRLSDQINTDERYLGVENLFVKAEKANTLGKGPYYFHGKHVEQSKYEEEYQKFLNDYKAVESSELQLIRWDTFDLTNKEQLVPKMADALIGSSQQFVDFKNK